MTISMVSEDLLLRLHFWTCPPIFLPVHNGVYPSKWRVDRSLHKAMGSFVIALISVHCCLCLSDPDGFLYLLGSFACLFINDFRSIPVCYVIFSCCMTPLHVYFSLFMLSFLCSSNHVFSSLPVSPLHSAPQFLHGIWYTSSPCSPSSTLSWKTNTHLRVVWGRMAVTTSSLLCVLFVRLPPHMG